MRRGGYTVAAVHRSRTDLAFRSPRDQNTHTDTYIHEQKPAQTSKREREKERSSLSPLPRVNECMRQRHESVRPVAVAPPSRRHRRVRPSPTSSLLRRGSSARQSLGWDTHARIPLEDKHTDTHTHTHGRSVGTQSTREDGAVFLYVRRARSCIEVCARRGVPYERKKSRARVSAHTHTHRGYVVYLCVCRGDIAR